MGYFALPDIKGFYGQIHLPLEEEGNLPCGKSSIFRFLDNSRFCWRKILLLFASKILFSFIRAAAGKKNKLFEVLSFNGESLTLSQLYRKVKWGAGARQP